MDITVALSCKLFAQIRRVLILDILDDWVPAAVIVDEIAIARGVDDVEAEPNAVLLDDMRDWVDLGGAADIFGGCQTTLGVNEMGCEDGVDESRLSEASLSCSGICD